MRERRKIEREFGVPIAGEILEPAQWTQTALKKLPPPGPLDFHAIYGRSAPLVVDLGCGNGRYLLGSAVWRPDFDHLGIDILPVVIRYATRRANQRGLPNIRFAVIDAARLLRDYIGPACLTELHCYHPQPYYDPAQASRRLITPEFLAMAHRALAPKGQFFIQTDNPGYWRYIQQALPVFFVVEERAKPWMDAPRGRTRREIIALRRGLPVFRAQCLPREDLSYDEALRLAAGLPPPLFDADRRLQELDSIEDGA